MCYSYGMKQYLQAASALHDSVEYKLLNLVLIYVSRSKKTLEITYSRGQELVMDIMKFEQVDALKFGLAEVICDLNEQYHNIAKLSQHVSVTTAYLLGACLNLKEAGFIKQNCEFLSNIEYVRSSATPGTFEIKGHHFIVRKHKSTSIEVATIYPGSISYIHRDEVDKLWPNGSTRIGILEALGLDGRELLDALNSEDPLAYNESPTLPPGLV